MRPLDFLQLHPFLFSGERLTVRIEPCSHCGEHLAVFSCSPGNEPTEALVPSLAHALGALAESAAVMMNDVEHARDGYRLASYVGTWGQEALRLETMLDGRVIN